MQNDGANFANNGENAYHVVIAAFANTTPTTRLDGFTITGGNANESVNIFNGQNIDRRHGGGMYTRFGTNTLTNNTISGNTSYAFGGGMYTNSGTNTLTNNTISGNLASSHGGGIFTSQGTNTLTNNTISGNSASINGGGIYTSQGTNTITNSIIWGNNTGIFGSPTVTYSIVQGGYMGCTNCQGMSGDGNIDPMFIAPLAPGLSTGGNYRLQSTSPPSTSVIMQPPTYLTLTWMAMPAS